MTNRLDAATRAALAAQWARTTPADDDAELGDVETLPPPARPKVLAVGEERQLLTKPNVQQLLSRPRVIAVGEQPPPLEQMCQYASDSGWEVIAVGEEPPPLEP